VSTRRDTIFQAKVDQGVIAAFVAEGYVKEDGSIDMAKAREAMYELLRPAKVLGLKERGDKAVTRGALVEGTFPNLPSPDSVPPEEADAYLAEAVRSDLDRRLWAETKPDARGRLQQLVGLNMGNGYVLCRTQVGKDRVGAAYITDNIACIERDFVTPDNLALRRKAEAVAANRLMLILRQPANGNRWRATFDRQMKAVAAAGHEQLTLAIESVSTNGSGAAEEEVASEEAAAS
jgi:hypothetical protein